jgi:hypothetical protein
MTTVNVELKYVPLPKQAEFHALYAKYRGFCGGWGNGKTSSGCMEFFTRLVEYPRTNAIVSRFTRPELKATTWEMLMNGDGSDTPTRWPGIPKEAIAVYNKSDLYIELRNGSKVWGLPLDDPTKLENYNLGLFMIDQAEEVGEDILLKFQGRLRQKHGPREGLLLFNPNGHNYLWKRFIDPDRPATWKQLYKAIEATPFDNPFLPEDYLDQFASLPQAWQDRFVHGSHDVFVGQIFTDWDPDVHIIPDFSIPRHWERWMCFDPGIRHEAAASWIARDELGNKFYYREVLSSGRGVRWWADLIQQAEVAFDQGGPDEDPVKRLIGPEANQRSQTDGKSVKELFWEEGIGFDDADKDPSARIVAITDALRPRPAHAHFTTGDDPGPSLYVFESCTKLKEYLPQYRWKPVRATYSDEQAPEKPRKKDDHNIDNLGHILLDMVQSPALEDHLAHDSAPVNELDRHFLAALAHSQRGIDEDEDHELEDPYAYDQYWPSEEWDIEEALW